MATCTESSNPYGYLLPLSADNAFICYFCFGLTAVYYANKVLEVATITQVKDS